MSPVHKTPSNQLEAPAGRRPAGHMCLFLALAGWLDFSGILVVDAVLLRSQLGAILTRARWGSVSRAERARRSAGPVGRAGGARAARERHPR